MTHLRQNLTDEDNCDATEFTDEVKNAVNLGAGGDVPREFRGNFSRSRIFMFEKNIRARVFRENSIFEITNSF